MGFYDKKIYYLDLYEDGESTGNAGFVKFEVRDNECRVWVSIRHMEFEGVVIAKLYLCSAGRQVLADQMILHQGIGTYAAKWEADHLAQTEITYVDLEGIYIELSDHIYIGKHWGEKKADKQAAWQDDDRKYAEKMVVTEESIIREKKEEEKDKITEPTKQVEKERIYATKWALMQQYYKKKIPFSDDREYLCITPEDLILLPEKYEYLLNNSFLLHGYYAYGHLMLGAIAVQSRNIYRLYIPGAGHEKEQIVAGLFGFGNFAPANERYGYYYMTVEL